MCDSYEERLIELLDSSGPTESDKKNVRPAFKQGRGFG
jgi:hypothetical protein